MKKIAGLTALLFAPVFLAGVIFCGIAYAEDVSDASKDNSAEVTKERVARIRPRTKRKPASSDIPGVKFNILNVNGEIFFTGGVVSVVTDQHMQPGEKYRMKVTGQGSAMLHPAVPSDWTPYNTVMFSVFVEGNGDWRGTLTIRDQTTELQIAKAAQFHNRPGPDGITMGDIPFVLAKGENKDFKIKLPKSLPVTNRSRNIDWTRVTGFSINGDKKVPIFINNIYLLNEQPASGTAAKPEQKEKE